MVTSTPSPTPVVTPTPIPEVSQTPTPTPTPSPTPVVTPAPGDYDIVIPWGVTHIEAEAFAGTAFTSIYIPETVTSIGSKAFAGNEQLRWIRIDNGDCQVAEDFLAGCAVAQDHFLVPAGSALEEGYETYAGHMGH